MSFFKRIVIALCLCTSGYNALATQWNTAEIDLARKHAITSINQFIQKDKKSELYQLLSKDEQKQVRQKMRFSQGTLPSFATLTNKPQTLVRVLNAFYGQKKISYAALLLAHSNSNIYNANAIYLYRTILENDEQGAAYAFQELDKLNLSNNEKQKKARTELHKRHGFSLARINIMREQAYPEVCLEFSKRVRGEPAQQWQGLIKVTPAPRGDWAYRGYELCFNGEWQTRYHIDIDQRLQSQYRLNLGTDKSETINTGTRLPSIHFAATGSVLNSGSQRHLAVSTANIDNVHVELWQIPANNLSSGRVQAIIESPQNVSSWRLDNILRREGEQYFQGSFNVGEYAPNETVTTNVFFDDLIGKKHAKPGIYVMTANNADTQGEQSAHIAFSLSNAGFSAYITDDGLWAELRDLTSTKPVAKQTVTLYARNNTVLGTAVTDDKGVAHFAKPLISGELGMRPSHVISENDDYFAYLDLIDTPVDLSDKGLSGTVSNAALNSWIWSDRGIYRPNDTAHVMWLLKTPDGKLFHNAPIWLELIRPDGKLFLDQMVTADDSGAYSFDHYFDNSTRQGTWTLRLSLGKNGKVLASKKIPVSAIVPQQVEASIKPIEKTIHAAEKIAVTVKADWLYGAPAADLSTSIYQSVTQREMSTPRWRNWHIGLHDDQRFGEPQYSDNQTTDKDGNTTFTVNVGELPFSTQPLKLNIDATVNEPSGQQVKAQYSKAISRTQPYLALQAGKDKTANIALINDAGQLQRGEAQWQLFRVHYDYYWYNQDGNWQYQHNESRQLITSGHITLGDEQPSTVKLPLDDGAWVLVVRGAQPNIAASIPLEYGRYASPSKDNAPDRIHISSAKARYRDGEKVTLNLRAPFDGKASVKFANHDSIVDNQLVEFSNGTASVSFRWDEQWNQGLWLLVNAWNENQQDAHNRRAVGLHWLGGDLAAHSLDLAISVPETSVPNTTLTIPLHIPAAQLGQPTWVRVAVIDDGLYRLAKASFSNPLLAFWDKKQLNVRFFDVWGSIIRHVKARQAALRSGAGADESGDLSALKALPELDLQLVTFWSKPVQFDSDGNSSVRVDIPQFNGRLRVMAAAWSADRLGAAEHTVEVRAPLVGTLYAPPYVSPGDSSQLRLRLHNTTKRAMTVTAGITSTGIDVADRASETLTLAPDQVAWVQRGFSVANDASGRASIAVTVGGDENLNIQRFADIRPRAYPTKTQSIAVLNAGKTQRFSAISDGQVLERRLLVSSAAPFDTENVLQQLSTYPYGCAEQVTSKAWNNLLLHDLIPRYQLSHTTWGNASQRESNVFSAQTQLANYQQQDGGFSLWGYNSADIWLSAYITEFLVDSQQAKQLGNPAVLERALAYLRSAVMRDGDSDNRAAYAYAHYVLAKAGAPVQGASMRFAENLLNTDTPPTLSTANLHTVSALVWHGELALATRLMKALNAQPIDTATYNEYANYGAGLRNYAQSLALVYQLQNQLDTMNVGGELLTASKTAINTLWPAMREALANQSYYSTQDLHWLATLATQLPKADKRAKVVVNGKALSIDGNKTLTFDTNTDLNVGNDGNNPVYLTLSDWVIPNSDSVVEHGYRIQMRYEDNNGNPVDIHRLRANQQVYAIATISSDESNNNSDIMFAYPLPSGLSLLASDQSFNDKADRTWFNTLKHARFSENRDDRHLAAFNVGAGETFTHVFMLRAARTGTWHAPAHSVENMYQPQFRAVYPTATVTVE